MNLKNFLSKIYINRDSENSDIAVSALKLFPETEYEIVDSPPFNETLSEGKKILYLTENKSDFLKKCPGTPKYICCDYNVLHLAEHCPMDCSYCILQVYFKNPYLTVFTNIEKMIEELTEADKKGEIVRVGSGEFTDSFALEKIGKWNATLIPFFSKCKNMFLELKSKYNHEDFLKFSNHNRRIIISFSLNSFKVQKNEEIRSASLKTRLKIARKAFDAGFINSFHFDPIIDYPGCIEDYSEVINLLFDTIDERNICWISLGTLRFIPALKETGSQRFPESKIYSQEFHPGIDGKFRYFVKRRIEIYTEIVKRIRKRSKNTPLYFCMESSRVWKAVFGFTPKNNSELSDFLDDSVKKVAKNF